MESKCYIVLRVRSPMVVKNVLSQLCRHVMYSAHHITGVCS